MPQRKSGKGLDFETLRLGIERCDPDLVLGLYAEDAELSIVNADAPQGVPFELRGKAEIAKYLRAVFGQGATHRVEQEVFDEGRVTFREACEYPDGSLVGVATTLELRDGRIVRQVDVVAQDARADRREDISKRPSARETQPGADVSPTGRLLRFEQSPDKEDLR
jgi:hypothetical protein